MIVGFPGETDDDFEILCDFLEAARMDVTGVFGYSDEDGTEAASYDDKLDDDEIAARVRHVTDLVEQLNGQRAEERIGEEVEVLVESLEDGEVDRPGRAPGSRGRRRDLPRRQPGRRSATWSGPWSSRPTASTWSRRRSHDRDPRRSATGTCPTR